MADEQLIRAAVYLDSKEAGELADEVLKPLGSEEPQSFSGVREGWLQPADAERLDDAGLVVQMLGTGSPSGESTGAAGAAAASAAVGAPGPDEEGAVQFEPPPSAEAGAETISGGFAKALTENADLIEDIKQQASTVSFAEDRSRLVFDQEPEAEPDPALHRYAQGDTTPPPDQAPLEDVYNIKLRGPITRAQRLELDDHEVDIAAFEPGLGYRAFLTRQQYATVNKLPYVASVTRYPFEQAIAPELLETVREDESAAEPGLMSAGEEQDRPQIFDCLLHREADLERIRALIDESPGTTILGTSNLRVRFSADVHLPFIAALAALPEVRKLSTYQVPKL
jgi:hypothetical protein